MAYQALPTTSSLFFKSLNPEASTTILLLHAGFASHHEWDLVVPYLSSYHLLIPDLPGHGIASSANIPFDLSETATLLADLVTKHAKDGKANLVGLSLGGYTAIYTAHKYPDIIGEGGLFVSGCAHTVGTTGSWKSWGLGCVMFFGNSFLFSLPKSAFDWFITKRGLQVNEDLYEAMAHGANYALSQAISGLLADGVNNEGNPLWQGRFENIQARTCIVAGGLEDPVTNCTERGKQLRVSNPQSQAFKVEGKRHGWDIQDPELFALGVGCWIEHEGMPEQFISLE
ncbi:Alpha/Beta hydrolase protein [Tricladium varicosporioides]|nr:Alpha/Beta hydrolase protein [Hymenoscyphus varicosporioides]